MKSSGFMTFFIIFVLLSCGFGGSGLFRDIDQQYTENTRKVVPRFSVSRQGGAKPLEVQFKDESLGNIVQWEWDFNGDGIIDSAMQQPRFVYRESGEFTPSLTVVGRTPLGLVRKSITGTPIFVKEGASFQMIDPYNLYPFSIASGDFNNDGFVDILGTKNTIQGVIWYPNNGHGGFDQEVKVSDRDGLMFVAAGDLDLDGDDDFVSVTFFPREILTEAEKNEVLMLIYRLSIGDVNSFYEWETYIAWWENLDKDSPGSGDGSSWQKHMVSRADSMFFFPTGLEIVDLDGDGDPDILSGASHYMDLVSIGVGDGAVISSHTIPSGRIGKTNKITWWENQSRASSWEEHDVMLFDQSVREVHYGDMNNDGRLDLLGSIKQSNALFWIERKADYSGDIPESSGLWEWHQIMDLNNAGSFTVGDFNLDGALDLMATAWNINALYFLENRDLGTRWDLQIYQGNYARTMAIQNFDLDNDGDQDIFLAPESTGVFHWLENLSMDCADSRWRHRVIDFGLEHVSTILGVDLNNDFCLDLAASMVKTGDSVCWWNIQF